MSREDKLKQLKDLATELGVEVKIPEVEIPEGTPCYFWDGERPDNPVIARFNSRNEDHRREYYDINGNKYIHCEPIPIGQPEWVENNQQQTSFTDVRFDALDTYYYVIYVYDRQGLKSSKSNVESTP